MLDMDRGERELSNGTKIMKIGVLTNLQSIRYPKWQFDPSTLVGFVRESSLEVLLAGVWK